MLYLKNPNGISCRNRKTSLKFIWDLKGPQSAKKKKNLEKKIVGGLIPPDNKASYKATVSNCGTRIGMDTQAHGSEKAQKETLTSVVSSLSIRRQCHPMGKVHSVHQIVLRRLGGHVQSEVRLLLYSMCKNLSKMDQRPKFRDYNSWKKTLEKMFMEPLFRNGFLSMIPKTGNKIKNR